MRPCVRRCRSLQMNDFLWAVSWFSSLCGEFSTKDADGVSWTEDGEHWLVCHHDDKGNVVLVTVADAKDEKYDRRMYAVIGYCAYHQIPYEIA